VCPLQETFTSSHTAMSTAMKLHFQIMEHTNAGTWEEHTIRQVSIPNTYQKIQNLQ